MTDLYQEELNRSASKLFNTITLALDKGQRASFTLMGPSGAGKSRLLDLVKEKIKPLDRVPCILVDANRKNYGFSVDAPMLQLAAAENTSDVANRVLASLFAPKVLPAISRPDPSQFLAYSNARMLSAARAFDAKANEKYALDAVEFADGRLADKPLRPTSKVKMVLDSLQEILGYRATYELPPNDGHAGSRERIVRFMRGDASLAESQLSDGEKQILLLSVFLLSSFDRSCVILIDEPELHLNDARAVEIWEKLETSFPKAVFLYATHSPIFATRPTVMGTFTVDMTGELEEMDTSNPVSASVVRDMVGTRVQILRKEGSIILCEDKLLRLVIEDLFSDEKVEIATVGGWEAVVSAVKGEPGWDKLRSSGPPFCGVIDRDSRTDEEVLTYATRGIFCFPLYEADSLLLDPILVGWMPKARHLSSDEYNDILVEAAKHRFEKTIRNYANHLTRQRQSKLSFRIDGLARAGPGILHRAISGISA